MKVLSIDDPRHQQHFHVVRAGHIVATYTDWDKANDHVESMRVGPEDLRWRQSDPWRGFYLTVCTGGGCS